MGDVFIYVIPLPGKVKGFSVPCLDGYTIYLDAALDRESMREVYQHEMEHIMKNDFECGEVQKIELQRM